VYVRSVAVAQNATTSAQDAFSNGKQQAGDLYEKGKEAASNASKQIFGSDGEEH
jgi:hypothetical protein